MDIEKEIQILKERNLRVESDKAWETSLFRLVSISVITYVIASLVMYFIGVRNFFLNAVIPVLGYVISAQSLPFVKKWWISKHYKKQVSR